jgi:hypothetical protein
LDRAIAICNGNVRAALRAGLVYNDFLERKLDTMRGMVSSGYTRGTISPERAEAPELRLSQQLLDGGRGFRCGRMTVFLSCPVERDRHPTDESVKLSFLFRGIFEYNMSPLALAAGQHHFAIEDCSPRMPEVR